MSDFVSQLSQALQMAASPDASQRALGEQQMGVWKSQNFSSYLQSLAFLLRTENAGFLGNVRVLAGLVLKNELKRAVSSEALAMIDLGTLQTLRESALFAVLQCADLTVRRQAAQVVSSLLALSRRRSAPWASAELYGALLQGLAPTQSKETREAVLVTLGYVCEENKELLASEDVNSILTGLVMGARDPEHLSVKKAALKALVQAIPLAEGNFARPGERDVMVSVAVDAVQQRGEVGVAGLECLITMVTWYYTDMLSYMSGLVPLTLGVVKAATSTSAQTQGEQLAMYAIEFWSALCDEELYLLEEAEAAAAEGKRCAHVVENSLGLLLPVLTQCLVVSDADQQSGGGGEDDEEGEWGLRMASAACLTLVAQVVEDKVVEPVLQFVNANFGSSQVSHREAAILAYGSIVEGPSTAKLGPLIDASFVHIAKLLEDKSAVVRDTTAWCIGRIVQMHSGSVGKFVQDLVAPLMQVLMRDEVRVAVQVAWVFEMIGTNLGLNAAMGGSVIECLMHVAGSRGNKRLTGSCYTAVGVICSHFRGETPASLLDELMKRMRETSDPEVMGYLCGCVQQVVSSDTLQETRVVERLETLGRLLLDVARLGGDDPVVEDAVMALSAVIRKTKGKYTPYVAATMAALSGLLAGKSPYGSVAACIGLVGDMARAVGKDIGVVLEETVRYFVSIVQRPDVDKRLKPAVIVCLGDLALASGPGFVPYVQGTLGLLGQAGRTRLEDGAVDDADWVDYLNELREAVLETFAGIIHSLRETGKQELFKEHVVVVLGIVEQVLDDKTCRRQVQKTGIQLVGDLVMAFQTELALFVKNSGLWNKLQTWTRTVPSEDLRDSGQWTLKAVLRFAP